MCVCGGGGGGKKNISACSICCYLGSMFTDRGYLVQVYVGALCLYGTLQAVLHS